MKTNKAYPFVLFLLANHLPGNTLLAQGCALFDDLHQTYEIQASLSDGKTPLWLNANRYGLSSIHGSNGYVRATLEKEAAPLSAGNHSHFHVGYGLDVALPVGYKDPHHTTRFIVQQAYLDLQYKLGSLTIGSRQQPMELLNDTLSSGAQTLGINARPIPQVRLGLNDYWTLPFFHDWVAVKGHMAYGVMTDGKWQEDFAQGQGWWTYRTLYHQKAGYIRIGKPERLPLQLTLGLEMASQFGGDITEVWKNGTIYKHHPDKGLKAFWHAFSASGYEWNEEDIVYQNVEGNQLGSWVARLDWQLPQVCLGFYADHFFEDHSSMFFLDYNGYGEGADWDTHERKDFFQYRMRDIMLGTEMVINDCRWLHNITLEWMNTRYQSGPIYHDHSPNLSTHISGRDDYYNHSTYAGWMHYGQVMGNPLYRSAVYNDDCEIYVKDNRFRALHLGLSGKPSERLSYRILASWQSGLGTYLEPYECIRHNSSYLIEGCYQASPALSVKVGLAMDRGSILGDNTGAQLTLQYHL